MDLSNYTRLIKLFAIVPVLVGVLSFAEMLLPNKTTNTKVVGKHDRFSPKSGRTTYTIAFTEVDEQFTEEIYHTLQIGDEVTIELTPIHKQITKVTLEDQQPMVNDTGEKYAIWIIGFVFMLCGLVWFKKGDLSKKQANYVSVLIVFSLISLGRVLLV